MALLLKPLVRADRLRPLRRHGARTVLTARAIDELFRSAEVLTEGALDDETWYGSVLMTFDLARLSPSGDDNEELDRLAEVIAGSVRVRIHAHRVARAQLHERYPDRSIGTVHVESRFRRAGSLLLLDLDLEAPIEVASTRSRRAR